MKDPNCAYCMKGDLVAKFGYPICEMETGFLYLFKEQSKKAESFWPIRIMSVK